MRKPIEGPVVCSLGRIRRTETGGLCQHGGVEELFCMELLTPERNGHLDMVARVTMPLKDLVTELLRGNRRTEVSATMTQYRLPRQASDQDQEETT